MDNKALFNISYGIFLLATKDGEKLNGCITNTCMQVANNPTRIAMSVINNNLTCEMLKKSKVFALSVLDKRVTFDTIKHFGLQSGRDVDKFKEMKLTPLPMQQVKAVGIAESPANIECRVVEKKALGSHTMFIAEVVGVTIDDRYMNETGKLEINESGLVMYSHGEYFSLGEKLGKFGYSIKKKS